MTGKLTSIVGPMFAWKTSRLYELVEKEGFTGRDFLVFNSHLDSRYGENIIGTHSGQTYPAHFISDSKDMFPIYDEKAGIHSCYIDEIQFFDEGVLEFVEYALKKGTNVFAFGLNLTAEGRPFPFRESSKNIGDLLAVSDEIEVLKGICTDCGQESSRTKFVGENKEGAVKIGNSEYSPVCRSCWYEAVE